MLVSFICHTTGTYLDVEVASGSKASLVVCPDEGLHMMKLWAAHRHSLKIRNKQFMMCFCQLPDEWVDQMSQYHSSQMKNNCWTISAWINVLWKQIEFLMRSKVSNTPAHIPEHRNTQSLYLLQSEAWTAFQTPGESAHLGHTMGPLYRGVVQFAYISVANDRVQHVCWQQPVRANTTRAVTFHHSTRSIFP